jgi:hypothetical protein
LDVWETYQRGLWHFYKYSVDENKAAQTFFRRAIEIDPNFAPGHYGLALAQQLSEVRRAILFPKAILQAEFEANRDASLQAGVQARISAAIL